MVRDGRTVAYDGGGVPMSQTVRSGDIVAQSYRVERVLGTGGMGVVVAARHVESGVLRAVKIMHREPAEGAGWAARFKREALVGQRLRSEHAVRVHDVGGFEEGRPWLVMEHLEGTDLGKLLRKRGPLPVPEAAGYVADACEAIAEAHEMGVVHRDLKPANLFLAKRPDGSTCIKVLDFGISKVSFGEDRDALTVTQSGEVIGSPAYMAPEQIRSFGNVDPRSDVWALGVILYELVTGRWPFPGKASVEMIAMVLERQPDPPRKHNPDLPAELEALLMRCVEKDLGRRLGSAKELQEALDPFVRMDDVTEDRPTPVAPQRAVGPDGLSIAPAAPVGTTGPQPVSVPPATTASQAVQRTLPIEPRSDDAQRARVKYVAAGALVMVSIALTMAVLRRAPAKSEEDRSATASAAPASSSAMAAGTSAVPIATSTAQREPVGDAPAASGPPVAGDVPAASGVPAGGDAPASAPPADGTPATDGPAASSSAGSEIVGAQTIDGGSDGVWRPWNKPGGKPLVDAPRTGDGRTVDPLAASAALRNAALAAKKCKKPGGPTGAARVDVSFAPSGQVASVRVGAPFDGTPVGSCIASTFHGARMPAFQGSNFSASKTVTIK